MYDNDLFLVTDPMADMLAELDAFFERFLDPDKPFVDISDEERMDIAERGFDGWLMGTAGIL